MRTLPILYHHTYASGKNLLFTTHTRHPHYLELEIHFPYAGVRVDYFDEHIVFAEEEKKEMLTNIAKNVVMNLRTVFQKFRELPETERQHLLREDELRKKLIDIVETECLSYCWIYWGKTLIDSVNKKLWYYLQNGDERTLKYSELEYPRIYRQLYYRYGGCEGSGPPVARGHRDYWLRRFESEEKNRSLTFKKLNCDYYTNRIPAPFTETVGYEEFTRQEKYRIPLFIRTGLGATPDFTPGLWEALEGQRIALLLQAMITGRDKALHICEVKDGELIIIEEYLNT